MEFLSKENMETMWQVLLDFNMIQVKSQNDLSNAKIFYINQSKFFFEKEKHSNQRLIQMNKKFIGLMSESFKQPHNNNHNHSSTPSEIQETEELHSKEYPYTNEKIQSNRINIFEKSLAEKQNEFNNAMSVSIPDIPKFSDDTIDEPILSMSQLISKTIAQRNFDLPMAVKIDDNININIKNSKDSKKSNDKIQQQPQYKYINQDKPKLIQIGSFVDEEKDKDTELKYNPEIPKNVTWGENLEYDSNDNTMMDYKNNSSFKNSNSNSSINLELKNINERMNELDNKLNQILDFVKLNIIKI